MTIGGTLDINGPYRRPCTHNRRPRLARNRLRGRAGRPEKGKKQTRILHLRNSPSTRRPRWPKAQRIDEESEGRRGLPAAWVPKVIA